ncbi:replication factor C large subunit [Candidatus Woesearchaeota archaeon]|nr:replication factor C large subunit [Candidatus Woesearchaeota archaeon]
MRPWILKYLPKSTSEVVGQNKAIEILKDYVSSYRKQKNKCALLYGGIGCGKTSSVVALTDEAGLELVEMNASDFRNKDKIEGFVGTAIKQQSLFFKGKIILIDEIDGLSGTKDRGAVQTLLKLIENSTFPVLCTCNDPYNDKLKALRKKSVLIEFHTLDYRSITNQLIKILDAEKCAYDEDAVKSLARRAGGDLRAAINDCQTLTASGEKKLTKESVDELLDNERNRTETLMNALLKVMKTTDIEVAKTAFDNIGEDIDTVGLWLEENIPKEYEGRDITNAMMMLSKADVYKGRIRRWQHWRFLVYINALYSGGVALAKDEKYKKFIKYGPPGRLLKIWQANMKYMKRKAIAEKIAPLMHTSSRRVIQDVMPYIRVIAKSGKYDNMISEFELEKEEIEWLKA